MIIFDYTACTVIIEGVSVIIDFYDRTGEVIRVDIPLTMFVFAIGEALKNG